MTDVPTPPTKLNGVLGLIVVFLLGIAGLMVVLQFTDVLINVVSPCARFATPDLRERCRQLAWQQNSSEEVAAEFLRLRLMR